MILINIIGIAFLSIHYKEWIEILNGILKKPKRVLLIGRQIFDCFKCTSFWVALIYTGDIGLAGFISLIGFTLDKYIISSPTRL